MLRQIPPLEAVEAFLAAAHAHSFRRAAATLALSPSAFSRRIQLLEQFVGTAMFDRNLPGTPLTRAGERYLGEIAPALESIRLATAAARGHSAGQQLRVATSHSFAAEWLMPRLPRLTKVHGIDVALVVSRDPAVIRNGEADVAIWGGPLATLDAGSEPIVELDAVAVSAPLLADGRAPPRSIAAIGGHRLLAVRASAGLWPNFLTAAGFTGAAPPLATFETNQLKYEAAVCGMGLALATPMLSERFLADRRLVACLDARQPTGQGYALHTTSARARNRPAVCDFAAWLRDEVAQSVARFDRWHAGTT